MGGDFVPGVAHSAGVGLRDGPELMCWWLRGTKARRFREVHPAALAPGSLDGAVRGGAEPGVGVGYHQAHPGEPPGSQRAQEVLIDVDGSVRPRAIEATC